jgi:site-specific recombinase XerD
MADLKALFSKFILDKTYIDRLTPKSLRTYEQSFECFQKHGGTLSVDGVSDFVVNASKAKLSPGSINTVSRSMNSFASWLLSKNHISEPIKVPKIKQQRRVLSTYTVDDARQLLSFRPLRFSERRLQTILYLLIDAGLRVSECLSLTKDQIDWSS